MNKKFNYKEIGETYVITSGTIRSVANIIGCSKSTAHNAIRKLIKNNDKLAKDIQAIILKNRTERHIRGGISTSNKYKKIRSLKLN